MFNWNLNPITPLQLIENAPRDRLAGVAHDFLAEIRVALDS